MDNELSDEALAGVLSYYFLPALVFLLVDPFKKSAFVRFHAIQAILLWTVCAAVDAILIVMSMTVPFASVLLIPVAVIFTALTLLVAAFGMFCAYKSKVFPLPWLGNVARWRSGLQAGNDACPTNSQEIC